MRILEILDLRDNTNEIDIGHGFTHQTGHDTEITNLDLKLPIDDFVLESRDEDAEELLVVLCLDDFLSPSQPGTLYRCDTSAHLQVCTKLPTTKGVST